ncbi:MAG: hypothetical protein ACREHV_00740 [Rhizomicrobium sp.]
MRDRMVRSTIAAAALLVASATAAEAYLGPGAGLSAIGSVVSVISAIFLAIAGFIWYPIKRLFKRRGPAGASQPTELQTGIEPARK